LFQLANHTKAIRHAAFSPDGRLAVTVSHDTTARLWDTQTGQQVGQPLVHGSRSDNWLYHASFSPDSRLLATGGFDNKVRLWDVRTGLLREEIGYGGAIRSIEFSPDGRYLLVGCWDRSSTRLWDVPARKPAGPPLRNAYKVNSARFSPDGARIVTADRGGIVCLWALPTINWRPRSLQASFSADGHRYAVIDFDSTTVEVRHAGDDHVLCRLTPAAGAMRTFLSGDGSRLLVLSTNTPVRGESTTGAQLWNVASTQVLSAVFACGIDRPSTGSREKLGRDGTRFATARGHEAWVWHTTNGQPVGVPLVATNSLNELFFSPDGRWIGGIAGKCVLVWDVNSGKHLLSLPHKAEVQQAEFSPDGRRLVTACADLDDTRLAAQVWDVPSGRPLGKPLLHLDGVNWASFSPDGRRVATASEDRSARVWDAETGERLTAQIGHGHEVWFAGFSPDGRWLLTTCRDNTARVWDAETGEPIIPPLRHLEPPSSAQFVADGQRIVTRRRAGDCWIWDLPAHDRSAADLVQMFQLLSQHRSERIDEVFPLDKVTLRNHWLTLHSRYPADFTIRTDEILYWHEREAEEAERNSSWSAALFHLDCLLKSGQSNPTWQQRRDKLAEKLKENQSLASGPR
jgi:WD40 repeat protein